jgi:hypothetical protein
MSSGLIYGAVVRGKGVLAQYYGKRDARDLEALASELGSETTLIDPTKAFAEKPRLKELMEVSVLILGRKIKGEIYTFVCVCEQELEETAEKFLYELELQCQKDLSNEKTPINLSSHFAKKIKSLMSGQDLKGGAKNIDLGRVQMLESEVEIMTGEARKNLSKPISQGSFIQRDTKFDQILGKANQLAESVAIS